MGLTDDEAAELAVLERELFAGSVVPSDAQVARYGVLREKKIAALRGAGAAESSSGPVDPVVRTPTDKSLTVPDHEARDDREDAATVEGDADAAESDAAESDPVGITPRLMDWAAEARRVPIRRRLTLIGLGVMGAAAIVAGFVVYGEVTKPQPVASGAFEAIAPNEAPIGVDEAVVKNILWSKLAWSGDFDLPGVEFFLMESRGATCIVIAVDGTTRGQGCASPGQAISFHARDYRGGSLLGEDSPVRLLVKDGKMTAWDDVPLDPEEYR